MNRWRLEETNGGRHQLLHNENLLHSQDGVRIDDGDKKTPYVNGELILTTHRLIWLNPSITSNQVVLHLSVIVLVDDEPGGKLRGSDKLVLHLAPPKPGDSKSVTSTSDASHVRLAFKLGGQRIFGERLRDAMARKIWDVRAPPAKPQIRSGISGIEKSMQQKAKLMDTEINKAFQDLDRLIERAKPMVNLANTIARQIREKQGDISDDETIRFKSYLMSLGISDPVTRETHGSGQDYFRKLAKEVYQILERPIKDQGGMITLSDAYCRVNRSRGMELISPEDLLDACNTFQTMPSADIPLRLHTFEATGVKVIQLTSVELTSPEILEATEQAVAEAGCLTAEELSRRAGLAVVLAKERLLAAERCGRLCRDDSVEGVKFYPNLFLTMST